MTDDHDAEPTDEESEQGASDGDDVPRSERADRAHLQGIEDGCGCAEVWEHLSDQRERNRTERAERAERAASPANED